MVVTSCRRFDLLERTLRSFFTYNDYPLKEVIVIEDSDDEGIFKLAEMFPEQPIRIIFNKVNIGQSRSVDKAYAEVETPYIFHIEDDWEFTNPGVIAALKETLVAEPETLLALARTETDMQGYVRSVRTRTRNGVAYKRLYPELHFMWYTFTFNPSLKRTADYRQIVGGYSAVGNEYALNQYYKAQSRTMCWVLAQDVRHIGGHGRSNYGKRKDPLFSRNNRLKWSQSLQRKFWHALRKLGIDTERPQRWLTSRPKTMV
ncbi:glycosyltransferase family 2 protein [Rhizobium panacihumi]|uniref:glycosyltransferase family 2 protein n=1 Tax=Rhizobium panacihumi TaxID=2008450 RepID=UPI003D78D880